MKEYTYWDNSNTWHGQQLLVVHAESIMNADKVFEEKTGKNPIKFPWIGCTITQVPKLEHSNATY